MLARCLVPLPLPPTPSPLSWRLFRLHHLLSRTPTKCLYFTATEPLLRVVVSSSLFIPPSPLWKRVRGRICMCVCVCVCSSSFSSAITFSSFSSSSSARQPTLAFLLASFVRFLLIPESTDHSSLFLHGEHSFLLPRDGLVTRLHRSPLFVRHPLRIPPLLLLLLVSFPRDIPARQSFVPSANRMKRERVFVIRGSDLFLFFFSFLSSFR